MIPRFHPLFCGAAWRGLAWTLLGATLCVLASAPLWAAASSAAPHKDTQPETDIAAPTATLPPPPASAAAPAGKPESAVPAPPQAEPVPEDAAPKKPPQETAAPTVPKGQPQDAAGHVLPEQPPAPAPSPESPWKTLEPGLDYAEFDREDGTGATLVVLRFNPKYFHFSLHTISEEGPPAKTLRQWADTHNLVAAINASMYLPDGSTSTGYMRQGQHVNNGRTVNRFGAFFVANPDDPTLPLAALLDRDTDNWQALLSRYAVVVQNYRMINSQRRILWSPGGPLYSISAVGQDAQGNILFIHCREPIEAYSFASLLLHLPLNVRTVMYVEGGAQAGLALRSGLYSRIWGGRHMADFLVTGNVNAALPNVLGVKRRKN